MLGGRSELKILNSVHSKGMIYSTLQLQICGGGRKSCNAEKMVARHATEAFSTTCAGL